MQELNDAINQRRRGKVADARGVNADTINALPEDSKKHLLRLYNKAINSTSNHHHTGEPRGSTLHQERERGITIELTTHVFDPPSCTNSSVGTSSIDYNPRQTPTSPLTKQASGYSTTDHFFTFQQLRQRATEWHQPLWGAAIDFKTTFDTVGHSREQGIEQPSILIFAKL